MFKPKRAEKTIKNPALNCFFVFGFRFVCVECVERHKRQSRTGERAEPPPPNCVWGWIFIDSNSLFFWKMNVTKNVTKSLAFYIFLAINNVTKNVTFWLIN